MTRPEERFDGEAYRPGCDLAEILVTEELWRRPSQCPAKALDGEGWNRLMAPPHEPDLILARLAEEAMARCGADSAGISIEEPTGRPPVFRWRAIQGRLAPLRGGAAPRHFSPSTEAVARNQPLLMADPGRHYPYIRERGFKVQEVLLVPLTVGGRPVGTVWAVHHDEPGKFSAAEARVMSNLASFAGAALTIQATANRLAHTGARLDEHSRRLREAMPGSQRDGTATV